MSAAKNRQNPFYEMISQARRTSHADQTRDCRWFDGRPGRDCSPGAGEEFRCAEDRRQVRFIVLPRLPAGSRWIMDPASMRGDGFRGADATKVRDAKPRPRNALNACWTDQPKRHPPVQLARYARLSRVTDGGHRPIGASGYA